MNTIKLKKTGWLIGLAAVLIVGAISYWYNCNTPELISKAGASVIQLATNSHVEKFSNSETAIALATSKMNAKQTNADIQRTYSNFLNEWKKTDTLGSKDAVAFRQHFIAAYKLQKERYSYEAVNEFLAIFIILLIVITFLCLALLSNLLRDITGNPAPREIEMSYLTKETNLKSGTNGNTAEVLAPYSLSRTQLAIWITIIGSVYTYAVFWDDLPLSAINNTALLLMGIAGGTFAAGAILDTTEIQQKVTRHQDQDVNSNFFKDILSDGNGISIHRFQNVVWTVIAIFVYFYKYGNPIPGAPVGLPELDNTLLALTGISSATYIILKTRENVGQKAPVNLNIILSLEGLSEKDAIMKSDDGLKNAKIDIIESSGGITHAKSDPTNPKLKFIASVVPGKSYQVKVAWTGMVNNENKNLQGASDVTIEPAGPKDITIQMNLA